MKRFLSGVGAIVFAVILLGVGILNIVLGVNRLVKLNAGKYVETQAVITKIETVEVADSDAPGGSREEYQLTVEYTVDGKKFVSQLSETPKEFYEGMELTVLYNTDKPTEVVLPGKTGAFIMIGMGVVAILAGVVLFLKRLRGR